MCPGVGRVDVGVCCFGCIVPADQWHRQAVGMANVVKAKPAFDAKSISVGGTAAALNCDNFIVCDLIGELTADAAIGANAFDFIQRGGFADTFFINQGGFHQGTGGAGLDAFAACNAGTIAHGVVKIEDNFASRAPVGHTDDIIDLDFTTGAYT